MGLQIANATYGRDSKGVQTLKSNLTGDIDKSIKVLTGSEYTNFIKTVQANWSGADADKFIQKFKESVKQIETEFKAYKSQIIRALDNDYSQFAKMQSSNASTVSGSIKKIN